MAWKSEITVKDIVSAGLVSPPLKIECNYRGVRLEAVILKEIDGFGRNIVVRAR